MLDAHWLRSRDPDLINLRRGIRAALIPPTIMIVGTLAFDRPLLSVIGFLASFVLLVFADLGGRMSSRAAAYALLSVLTMGAMAAGSLLADTTVAAAAVMFAIMFAATFASTYGGYAQSFVAPIALAYSFAVFLPLETIGLGDRMIGWIIGAVAASVAALVIWPVNARAELRQLLAGAAADLADAISGSETQQREAALNRAQQKLESAREKTSAQLRPAGLATRDVSLLHLLSNLSHGADLTSRVIDTSVDEGDRPLTDETAKGLKLAADTLVDRGSTNSLPAAIEALDRARQRRREEIRSAATGDPGNGGEDAIVLLHRSFPWLALSHLTLWIEADAAGAAGRSSGIDPVPSAPELNAPTSATMSVAGRAGFIALAQLDPNGVIFRNSIRMAVAMTLGVIAAKISPLEHGFWITLGILSVLRSSAQSTSATALRAVAGTFAGFLVAAIVLIVAGNNTTLLWWLMPPLVFLSAYTPGAVGFAVGQVAFTTMVVVVFTLVQPAGIETDVLRLETVSIGAFSAAIVALILWPRGARAALAHAAANVYKVAAAGLGTGLEGAAADRRAADLRLIVARQKAHVAFAVALGEHGEHIDGQAWSTLSRPMAMERSILGGLLRPLPPGPPAECGAALDIVRGQRKRIEDRLKKIADQLDSGNVDPHPESQDPPVDATEQLNTCLVACTRSADALVEDAVIIAAWSDWLAQLDKSLQDLQPALEAVAHAAAPNAWLRWSPAASKG